MANVDLIGSAKAVVSKPSLLGDRERITVDELIARYPGGVTVNGFNAIDYKGSPIYDFLFKEDPTKFFNGGGDLLKMGQSWDDRYSIDEINASLAANPIKIKIEKIRTKTNKTYTKVTVLSDSEQVDGETGEVLFDRDDDPF